MPYVTYAERVSRAKGMIEGLQLALIIIVDARFGDEASSLHQILRTIDDSERLEALIAPFVTAKTISDARTIVAEYYPHIECCLDQLRAEEE